MDKIHWEEVWKGLASGKDVFISAKDKVRAGPSSWDSCNNAKSVQRKLGKLSVAANWFWHELLIERNFTSNIAHIAFSDKTEQNRASIGYKELREKGLVLRLFPHKYFLNPSVIYPAFGNWAVLKHEWAVESYKIREAKCK